MGGDGVQMSTASYLTASSYMRQATSALPASGPATSYDVGHATVSRWIESAARWANLVRKTARDQATTLTESLDTIRTTFDECDRQIAENTPNQPPPSSGPHPPLAPPPKPGPPIIGPTVPAQKPPPPLGGK